MTSELVKITIVDKSPLPLYHVEFTKPDRWEGMIAELQQAYLKGRGKKRARTFNETIQHLIHLSISFHHYQPDQVEKLHALAFATLNMEDLYLLLVDTRVTEILSNKIGNDIIITHQDYGRCRTNLKFDQNLWDSLSIRAEYDSGHPLNATHPALKIGLQTSLGNLRISLQVDPLSVLGPTFSLRRLPSEPISLETLTVEEQISSSQADLLLQALQSRENIIIAGEPGSGKTTLANALLEVADKSWRLIILEDAREISIDAMDFPLLIHYRMPAIGSGNRYSHRVNEIARLLHRSPDYVFLGEIQNREDTKVTFEGFASGIRGMATTHAKNMEGLKSRWIDSHRLPPDLMKSIDWIVMTSRKFIDGKISLGIGGIYKMKSGEVQLVSG